MLSIKSNPYRAPVAAVEGLKDPQALAIRDHDDAVLLEERLERLHLRAAGYRGIDEPDKQLTATGLPRQRGILQRLLHGVVEIGFRGFRLNESFEASRGDPVIELASRALQQIAPQHLSARLLAFSAPNAPSNML